MIQRLIWFLSYILAPLLCPYLYWRCTKGKEDKNRLFEKWGKPSKKRPKGKLIWIHAVSVGESLTALTVIQSLQKKLPKSTRILLTTSTKTSAELMKNRLPKGVIHQYFPLDAAPWVKRFWKTWKPDCVIWFESELWPNHLFFLSKQKCPAFLINARLSKKSAENWKRFSGLFRALLKPFKHIITQSEEVQKTFTSLNIQTDYFGNLKLASPQKDLSETHISKWKKALGDRPIWLATSTHPGEEELIFKAHQELLKSNPDALCLLAPRHPERSSEILEFCKALNLSSKKLSNNRVPSPKTQVYLIDQIGQLDLFYHLSPISFIGGSLVPIGGHNMIEPLQWNSVALTGPHTDNFKDIVKRLKDLNACFEVSNAPQITSQIQALWKDKKLASQSIKNAAPLFKEHKNVLSKVTQLILQEIEK